MDTQPVKCINYEYCQEEPPQWVINHHPPYCMNCAIASNGTLQFRDTTAECCICMDHKGREMKFPTCSHWFCVSCCRNLLSGDETKYHLSQVPFGCPPCPNGCENPERGTQCYCRIYYDGELGIDEIGPLSVVQAWEKDHPESFKRWNQAEIESIDRGNINGEVWGSRKCPLCRTCA